MSTPAMHRRNAEDSAPRAGEVLAGRYFVERVIGTGGMGCVVAATHVHLDERVAVKLLHPHLVSEPDTVQRFLREGRTAGRIQSPHVVRIKDVGELDGGRPYIVMEYLEGEDLAAIQKQRGMLPAQQAVDYVLAAAEAIAEAHAMRMLHRDLKPSNIFLARMPDGRDCIKVLDFGIAKAFGAESMAGQLTQTAMVMGTPAFMAPEQLRKAKGLDHRVDIWALGVLLHKLVTNTLPFEGDTFAELSAAILTTEPVPLRRAFPHHTPELEAVIATCLRKNPEERFFDLADLALALAPLGTPAARPNVERILATLGRPSQRAVMVAPSEPLIGTTGAVAMSGAIPLVASPAAAPPRKSNTGMIAFVALAAVLALVGLGTSVYAFRVRANARTGNATSQPTTVASPGTGTDVTPSADPRVVAAPASAAQTTPPNTDSAPSAHASVTATAAKPTRSPLGKAPASKATGASPPSTGAAPPPPGPPPTPGGIATSSKD